MIALEPPPQIILPDRLARPAIIRPADKALLGLTRRDIIGKAEVRRGLGFMPLGLIANPNRLQGVLTARSGFSTTSNVTPYTWSGMATGTATATRYCIVQCTGWSTSGITGVTIGGIAATLAVQTSADFGIYYALVPTGTTANVVATFSTTSGNVGQFAGWTFDNGYPGLRVISKAVNVAANTASNVFLPTGSCVVAFDNNVGGPYTTTWTGLTQNYNSGSVDTGYLGSAHTNAGLLDATVSINASQTYTYAVLGR